MNFFNYYNRDVIIYLGKFMNSIDFGRLLLSSKDLYKLFNEKLRKKNILESFLIKKFPFHKKLVNAKGTYDWKMLMPLKGEPELDNIIFDDNDTFGNIFCKLIKTAHSKNISENDIWHCKYTRIHKTTNFKFEKTFDVIHSIEFDNENVEFEMSFNDHKLKYLSKTPKVILNIPSVCLPFNSLSIKILSNNCKKIKVLYLLLDNRRKELQNQPTNIFDICDHYVYGYIGGIYKIEQI